MTTLQATVLGFATYDKQPDVTTEDLIDACLTWQREFLAEQPGILMHRFLANTRGQFADAMLAEDAGALARMAESHPKAPSSAAFMNLLRPETVTLRQNAILGDPVEVPTDFSCIEYGTFSPSATADFTEARLLAASRRVEDRYLRRFDAPRGHFVTRVADDTYAEVAFGHTLGQTRRICQGYAEDTECADLLSLCDPSSVDLDFWLVLA